MRLRGCQLGLFIGLSYTLLVFGGRIADAYFGAYKAIKLGAILLILGCLVIYQQTYLMFCFGLSLLLVGSGLLKINCTMLVGQLYSKQHVKREAALTWFYCAINLGSIIGALLFGLLSQYIGWRYTVLTCGLLILLANVLLVASQSLRHLANTVDTPRWSYAIVVLVIASIFAALRYSAIANELLLGLFVLISIYLANLLRKQPQRKAMLGLVLLCVFSMGFFVCSLQIVGSVTLFIQRDITRVLLHWQIPVSVFSTLDPLFVVLCAPIFMLTWRYLANYQREPSIGGKVALSIGLAALAFLLLAVIAGLSGGGHHSLCLLLLLLVYLLLGAGEICLSPVVLATISRYSPPHLTSTMTSLFYLFVAFAGYLSGQVSRLSDMRQGITQSASVVIYQHLFLLVAGGAVLLSVLVLLMVPFLRRCFAGE